MIKKSNNQSVFDIDGRPNLTVALPLSLQHIFAMIMGTVTAPIIVANVVGATEAQKILLVQYALIIAGITTLTQLYPIGKLGSRLPIVYGVGFTYLPILISIGSMYGLEGILGAQIVGGIATMLFALSMNKIRKFFPPVVAGTVVFSIGLSLYPVAINYMAGGVGASDYGSLTNWLLAFITLAVVIVCANFGKGYMKISSILCGIIVGYTLALILGKVNFDSILKAQVIIKPQMFSIKFYPIAIAIMVVGSIANLIQSIGDMTGTTVGGLEREPTNKELTNGILGYSFFTFLGGIFGGLPTSSYSQNVGIVSMTKVVSRFVLGIAAVFMILSGLFPKFAALMTTIPPSVLGGATIPVFSIIAMTGIKILLQDGLSNRNITIVGLAIALSVGITSVPDSLKYFPDWFVLIFGKSSVVIAAIISFLLNIILPKEEK